MVGPASFFGAEPPTARWLAIRITYISARASTFAARKYKSKLCVGLSDVYLYYSDSLVTRRRVLGSTILETVDRANFTGSVY